VENKIFNFGKILLHERESYAKPIINVVARIYQGLARLGGFIEKLSTATKPGFAFGHRDHDGV
jgi:DUF917 family protein